VLHKDRAKTKHVIALFPGQAPPKKQPGLVYIDPEIPPENDKHVALGRFMDTWSKFETQLRNQVDRLLLTADKSASIAVSYSASGMQLMNLLASLASIHISGHAKREYANLGERFSKLNTKRNYLVHGSWTLELVVHLSNAEPAVTAQEVREFPPVDAENRAALDDFRNQSARGRYLFTLPRIATTERDVAALYRDFAAFHRTKLP
jgi:hypothetical protein